MSSTPARIHPTAIVDPAAWLDEDVEIGPYAIIEGPVRLGPGCRVRARVHLSGEVSAGAGNDFGVGCIVGERAQHLLHREAPGRVDIGDHNVIREYVTIHRGTPGSTGTTIGNHNYLMANSHVAHDCRLGNHCIMANGAIIGGHVRLDDRVFLSGNTGIHQQVRIGRLALVSAASSATQDVPPFSLLEGRNRLAGVNVVGMKRAGLSPLQINGARQAFRILLASGLLLKSALVRIERELGHIDTIAELLKFIHTSQRGICLTRARRRREAD
jgi:UDP-N-acetylglucosamine acyltransferase